MSVYESLQTGTDMSRVLAEQTAQVASTYPQPEGTKDLVETLNTVVDMAEGPERMQQVAAAVVVGRVFAPYLIERAQEITDKPEEIQAGLGQVARDAQLMGGLYRSTADLALSTLRGGVPTKPPQETAEQVFRGGPMIAKIGQSLPGVVKGKDDARSEYIRDVGRFMQEGVSLPQEDELPQLAQTVPDGLMLDGVVSSASVAHILRVKDKDGTVYAQKVPRPDFDQAMSDNVRSYVIASDVADRFMKHNAPETSTEEFDRVRQVMPFLLKVLEQDIRGETDFEREAAMQQRARDALQGSPVRVPEVLPQYTTNSRIVMEYMPAARIEDVPADPRYLKNIGIMCVRLWKAGLIHGDMHPGNIKGMTDGSGDIAAYDWGRTVERRPGMIKNLGSYFWALARKNPTKIAQTYQAIQSSAHTQATLEQTQAVAEDVIASVNNRTSKSRGLMRRANDTYAALQGMTIGMGIRHQSSIDADYLATMRSSGSLVTLVKDVLRNPGYGPKRQKLALGFGMAKAMFLESRRRS